jgi:outer membrane protein assembly factor BamB
MSMRVWVSITLLLNLIVTYQVLASEPAGKLRGAEDTGMVARIASFPPEAEIYANRPGICLDLGCGDGLLDVEIAQKTKLTVFALAKDDQDCAAARLNIDKAGLYGSRATVVQSALKVLPLPTGYGNLIVTGDYQETLDLRELFRVLNPNGIAIVGGGKTDASKLKAALESATIKEFKISGNHAIIHGKLSQEVDNWTHYGHGPDNNRTSRETAVRPPFRTQWLGGSTADDQFWFCNLAVADGRAIYHTWGSNHYYAWDSYNGVLLWERQKPTNADSRYALIDGVYYTPEKDAIMALDASTGKELREFTAPGSGDWLWLAVENGTLYALSRGALKFKSPFGEQFHAFNLKDGSLIWKHQSKFPVDARGVCLGSGLIYAASLSVNGQPVTPTAVDIWNGAIKADCSVAALNMKTGEEQWQTTIPWSTPGALYVKFQASGAYAEGKYFLWGSGNVTRAFDPKTGAVLKEYPDANSGGPNGGDLSQPLFLDGKMYPARGRSYKCIDIASGAVVGTMDKAGCGAGSASATCFYSGGQGFSVYDVPSKKSWVLHGLLRTPCIEGPTAANGLLFNMPGRCKCPYLIMTPIALAPAGTDWIPPDATKDIKSRLTSGPAAAAPVTEETIDSGPYLAPKTPPGLRLTAAVSGGGLCYTASLEGIVWGSDPTTGEIRWKFFCGAGVHIAPTFHSGRVLIGSDDGCVYCLQAKTGQLAWCFQASPEKRYVNIQGAMSSAWPVRTGVAVDNDAAYFGAGLFPFDGTYLYAIDLKTGESLWARRIGDMDHQDGVAQTAISVSGDSLVIAPVNKARHPTPTLYSKSNGEKLSSSKK